MFLLVPILTTTALAQELAPETLDQIKAATVFVKLRRSSGSGFLFKKADKVAYVITCAHVVGDVNTVQVVFDSGTKKERIYSASVATRDESTDLACLLIQGANELPRPLNLEKRTLIRETENAFAAGFPFGQWMSTSTNHPNISLSKTTVSSIRQDDDEQVVIVQLSGGVDPGNSGGPVVNSKGEVVGVAQSKILLSSTSFAIPCEILQKFLRGRIGGSTYKIVKRTATTAEIHARISIIDPTSSMDRVGVAFIRKDQLKTEFQAGSSFPNKKASPEMREIPLKIDDQTGTASATFEVQRSAKDPETIQFYCQAFCVQADGTVVWTVPTNTIVAFADETLEPGKSSDTHEKSVGNIDELAAPTMHIPVYQGETKTIQLAGPADEVIAGGGGRYLILLIKSLLKLAIVDICEAKVVKYITIPSAQIQYAAGATKLVVALPEQNLIQCWNLNSPEKASTTSLPGLDKGLFLSMGSASEGPLLIGYDGHTTLLDPNNFKIWRDRELTPRARHALDSFGEQIVDLRRASGGLAMRARLVMASTAGDVFGGCSNHGSEPNGLSLLSVQGDDAVFLREHWTVSYVIPSPDGNLVFSSGGIFSPDLRSVKSDQLNDTIYLPSYLAGYFLGVSLEAEQDKPRLRAFVYSTSGQKRVFEMPAMEEMNAYNGDDKSYTFAMYRRGGLNLSKRFHFLPSANLIATIPYSNDQIVIRRVSITEELEKKGINYLFVCSTPPRKAIRGRLYTYQIEAQSRAKGLTFSLDGGIDGMSLSKNGRLDWTVPHNYPDNQVGVIVTIRDSAGQEIAHAFNVRIGNSSFP